MAFLDLKLKHYFEVKPDFTPEPNQGILSLWKSILGGNDGSNDSCSNETAGREPYSDKKVLSILQDFLQPNTTMTMQSAVNSILDILPIDELESTEVFAFAGVCLEVSGQIPYHHLAHIKLARLVEKMCQYIQLNNGPSSTGFIFRFSPLQEYMTDYWSGPNEDDPNEWPNTNAFYANIEECHISPPNPTFAISVMRDAFERSVLQDERYFPGMRDQYILAAAQWILWSGHSLFKQILYPDDEFPNGQPIWEPGPLYGGPPLLSVHRWRFWRDGFKVAAQNHNQSGECRNVSSKVVKMMESIEEAMTV